MSEMFCVLCGSPIADRQSFTQYFCSYRCANNAAKAVKFLLDPKLSASPIIKQKLNIWWSSILDGGPNLDRLTRSQLMELLWLHAVVARLEAKLGSLDNVKLLLSDQKHG